MARRYSARVVWQQDGTKYQRDAELTVEGSSVKVAAAKAVAAAKKTAKGWREPFGASFSIHIVVGPKIGGKGEGA